jgi:hypothetical protein
MTTQEMKDWIDSASYTELLRKWRFGGVGDPFFQGEVGEYYAIVMREKRNKLSDFDRVQASKNLGW